MPLNYYL